ncbi:MAG: O-antigen ligase family protein [Planctomycetota bacterium]
MDWGQGEFSMFPPTSLLVEGVSVTMGLLAARDWRLLSPAIRIATQLIMAATLYGLLLGLGVSRVGVAAVFEYVNWIAPLMALLYVARLRPTLEQVKGWVVAFAGIAVLAGAYGWVQWLILPPWSKFWVVSSGMGSIGQPVPIKVRFFGSFSAPGGMGRACSLVAVLLLMFKPFKPPVLWTVTLFLAGCALASFVRSSWLTAMLCIIFFLLIARGKDKVRVAIAAAVVLIALAIVAPMLPGGDRMISRFTTLSDVQGDGSFQGRMAFSGWVIGRIMEKPWGYGMGTTGAAVQRLSSQRNPIGAFDNGFLQIPYSLGIPGAVVFWIGIVKLAIALGRTRYPDTDRQLLVSVAFAVSVGHMIALAVANFFKTDLASIFYIFLAAGLCATPSVGRTVLRGARQRVQRRYPPVDPRLGAQAMRLPREGPSG